MDKSSILIDLVSDDEDNKKNSKPSKRAAVITPSSSKSKQQKTKPNKDEGQKKPHICTVCGKGFLRKCHMLQHVQEVHEGVRIPCDKCNSTFTKKSALNRHVKSVHEKFTLPCDRCDKTFTQKISLDNHIKSVHEGLYDFPCKQCNKGFSRKSQLDIHMATHQGITYPCEQCEKKFSSKYRLDLHVKAGHESIQDYTCDECQQNFSTKFNLNLHVNFFHKGEFFACNQCDAKFSRKDHLEEHEKASHEENRPFSCDQCSTTYKRKRHLTYHVLMHNPLNHHKCSMCAFTTKYNSAFRYHTTVFHAKTHKLSCLDCGRGFGNEKDLERHAFMHSVMRGKVHDRNSIIYYLTNTIKYGTRPCGMDKCCMCPYVLKREYVPIDPNVFKKSAKPDEDQICQKPLKNIEEENDDDEEEEFDFDGAPFEEDAVVDDGEEIDEEEDDKEDEIDDPKDEMLEVDSVDPNLAKISSRFNCKTIGVIYLISCAQCPGVKYVGQTKNSVKSRFKQHLNSYVDGKKENLYRHFRQPGHSHSDIYIEVLQKSSLDLTQRLAEESAWITIMNSFMAKHGLNMTIGRAFNPNRK